MGRQSSVKVIKNNLYYYFSAVAFSVEKRGVAHFSKKAKQNKGFLAGVA